MKKLKLRYLKIDVWPSHEELAEAASSPRPGACASSLPSRPTLQHGPGVLRAVRGVALWWGRKAGSCVTRRIAVVKWDARRFKHHESWRSRSFLHAPPLCCLQGLTDWRATWPGPRRPTQQRHVNNNANPFPAVQQTENSSLHGILSL